MFLESADDKYAIVYPHTLFPILTSLCLQVWLGTLNPKPQALNPKP